MQEDRSKPWSCGHPDCPCSGGRLHAAEPSRGAPDAIAKLRATRTAWHEDFGVPVSQTYADFLTAIGECEDLLTELQPVKRATGRTIPDLTKREHVYEYQQSVKPRESGHVVLLEALREIVKWCNGENQVDDGEDAEDALV